MRTTPEATTHPTLVEAAPHRSGGISSRPTWPSSPSVGRGDNPADMLTTPEATAQPMLVDAAPHRSGGISSRPTWPSSPCVGRGDNPAIGW